MLRWIKNNFPNLLTASNLACGILGILLILEKGTDAFALVGYLVLLAGIFDFFDGFAARLLGSSSNIGKDLDSLADLVTFGILPTVMVYSWCRHLGISDGLNPLFSFASISIGIFSAVRLAIFNNDTRQSDQFIGVPTPANAFFLVFLVISQSQAGADFYFTRIHWLVISAVSSFLLVSPIPLIALKFKDYGIVNNWQRYLLISVAVLGLAIYWLSAIPLLILVYIGLSILANFLKK
ncbi:MAG TPA: CDP-alcohol phosphatidyltransferase family protein [Catalimonadaceae bacterium]|nr:CDP-alcohol phosphatidyltransferase family protein [Catalimonadaceae bacterium]